MLDKLENYGIISSTSVLRYLYGFDSRIVFVVVVVPMFLFDFSEYCDIMSSVVVGADFLAPATFLFDFSEYCGIMYAMNGVSCVTVTTRPNPT